MWEKAQKSVEDGLFSFPGYMCKRGLRNNKHRSRLVLHHLSFALNWRVIVLRNVFLHVELLKKKITAAENNDARMDLGGLKMCLFVAMLGVFLWRLIACRKETQTALVKTFIFNL